MASIKGIEIKGVKTFRGEEYPVNYQGNVYYNGKKLGFWSQDSWGGPDRYDFDTTELDAIAKEYYDGEEYCCLDGLMGEIIALQEDEKTFKKAVKNGFASLLVITDGLRGAMVKIPYTTDKEQILKECEEYIKDFEEKSYYKDKMKTTVFTCLEDFVQ